jgi:TPR repeat protein
MQKLFIFFASCILLMQPCSAAYITLPDVGSSVEPSLKEAYNAFKSEDFKRAGEMFRVEALKGNQAAQFALGILFQEGKGMSKNVQVAMNWYQRAAVNGHVPSQYNLALLMLEDASTVEKGIEWLKMAANGGGDKAMLSLGNLYLSGQGVKADPGEARNWLENAAKLGNVDASFRLGLLHDSELLKEGADKALGLRLMEETASKNHLPAVLYLAQKYRAGAGVEKSLATAEKWYRVAADLNSGEGQMGLGELYELGEGVEQDYAEALRLYVLGAQNGVPLGNNKAGYFYENGLGVETDLKKAIEYYTKAADQGFSVAMYNLSVFYASGKGVEKDNVEAAKRLYQAAAGGLAIAQNELGVRYLEGNGLMQDFLAAGAWFERAAGAGMAGAMVNLARMHAEGIGFPRNFSAAAKYFEMAAQAGDIFSHLQLARMLKDGYGVKKDLVLAWRLILRVTGAKMPPNLTGMLKELETELNGMLTDAEKKEAESAPAPPEPPAEK